MDEIQKEQLRRFTEPFHEKYDENVAMLSCVASSRGYHTFLEKGMRAHNTLENFQYALAVFDTGQTDYYQRALDCISKVVSLQDTDEQSETYGLWSYYLEEPLGQMNPPDWNWANFCGKILLQIYRDYAALLGEKLEHQVKQAIIRASASIIRRNVGPDYTNISVMGAYVTMATGELFGRTDFFSYGKWLLKRLVSFTITHGNFNEYNSPDYSVLAIEDASLIYREIQDEEVHSMAEYVIDKEWETISAHYHAPSGQWGGPQARSYNNFLTDRTKTMLQIAMGDRVVLTETPELCFQSFRFRLECPERFVSYFQSAKYTYDREFVSKGFLYPFFHMAQIATNYNTEKFTLGSFNRSEMWAQIRPILSYFGKKEQPACLRLRMLHDFYDFSTAQLHTAQEKGNLLSVLNFANDRGDTHVCLDMLKNASFTAKDLRIRLQIEGVSPNFRYRADGNVLRAEQEGIHICFQVPFCKFGDFDIRFVCARQENTFCFDVVLYSGEEKLFHLNEIETAVCVMALSVSEEELPFCAARAVCCDNKINAQWSVAGGELSVVTDSISKSWEDIFLHSREYWNGKWVVDITANKS